MPYCVGTKNEFVVTWQTKTKFHSGVFGKLPPDPPPPPWPACWAASRLHPARSRPAALIAPAARNCRRPSLRSPSPYPSALRSLNPCLLIPHCVCFPARIVIPNSCQCQAPPRLLLSFLSLIPPQGHPGGGATVDVQDLSRNEIGVVGGEEGDRRGDVFGVPDPAPRDQGAAELRSVAWNVEVARHLDETGAHGVDPDVLLSQLYGELAGEGVDRTLGGRVGRVPGEPSVAVDRGDVHDGTPARLKHVGHRPAGAEEVSLHVEVEHLVVGGLVGVEEVEGAGYARVVDQDVEAAQRAGRFFHHALAVADLAQEI